jgi:hypothetical protein
LLAAPGHLQHMSYFVDRMQMQVDVLSNSYSSNLLQGEVQFAPGPYRRRRFLLATVAIVASCYCYYYYYHYYYHNHPALTGIMQASYRAPMYQE